MKHNILLAIALVVAFAGNSPAQEKPFEPIARAIQESDAASLSRLFNQTVELHLSGNENTYSRSQAEMIMKDFFKKYPPDSFKIIREGTTDPFSLFAIGEYISGKKDYQVYIHLKKEKEDHLIQKLKFSENR